MEGKKEMRCTRCGDKVRDYSDLNYCGGKRRGRDQETKQWIETMAGGVLGIRGANMADELSKAIEEQGRKDVRNLLYGGGK